MKSILSRLWARRAIRGSVWILFSLLTLVVLTVAIIDWRGARHWKEVQAMLEKEGETLDFRTLTPDPVPDEQNFCATPALLNLADEKEGKTNREALAVFDLKALVGESTLPSFASSAQTGKPEDLHSWNQTLTKKENATTTDLLDALSAQDAIVAELTTALARPEARWTPQWRTRELPDFLYSLSLPHFRESQNLAGSLTLRTLASIEVGDTTAAHEATRILLHLSRAHAADPFLIGLLVSVSTSNLAVDSVWHLCAARAGTAEQFDRLEADIAKIDFDTSALLAWRGEMAASVSAIEWLTRVRDLPKAEREALAGSTEGQNLYFLPLGILLQNAATVAEWQREYCLKPLRQGGIVAMQGKSAEYESVVLEHRKSPLLNSGSILAPLLLPATSAFPPKAIHAQALVNQARLACGLERHYQMHKSYPETLGELGVAGAVDPWSGEAMHYEKTPEGRYRLWSIGPDRVDDGGRRMLDAEEPATVKFRDPKYRGDWVWDYQG